MLIKYQALASQLKKTMEAVYVLVGQEPYLLNEAKHLIKTTWRERHEAHVNGFGHLSEGTNLRKPRMAFESSMDEGACLASHSGGQNHQQNRHESDETILNIHTPDDWEALLQEANSYSLFSENRLLDARFDKKSLDKSAKDALTRYLKTINSRCLIILQMEHVPVKQVQWLSNTPDVMVIHLAPFTSSALHRWIKDQLQERAIRHTEDVPELIHQYTQGNMLASAQAIEQLSLIADPTQALTANDVRMQLIDQSEFQLYELTDACLNANAEKALHILRQISHDRAEPALILWLLAQEIRQLLQLSHLRKQQHSISSACQQLKIWPQRTPLYERTLARSSLNMLHQLLHQCALLDERIKTNQNSHVWDGLERLALSLCLGRSL